MSGTYWAVVVGVQPTPIGPVWQLCVEVVVRYLNRLIHELEAQFLIQKFAALVVEVPVFAKVCQFVFFLISIFLFILLLNNMSYIKNKQHQEEMETPQS